jgi:hypothetical protein
LLYHVRPVIPTPLDVRRLKIRAATESFFFHPTFLLQSVDLGKLAEGGMIKVCSIFLD